MWLEQSKQGHKAERINRKLKPDHGGPQREEVRCGKEFELYSNGSRKPLEGSEQR